MRPTAMAGRKRMTIHCANTGAMTGCATPGSAVWFSTSANPRRKYAHTLELVRDAEGDLIGVNTGRANGLVAQALAAKLLPGFPSRDIETEVNIPNERGRFDLRVGDVVRGSENRDVEGRGRAWPRRVSGFREHARHSPCPMRWPVWRGAATVPRWCSACCTVAFVRCARPTR